MMSKTFIKPGYGGMSARNINAPAPKFAVRPVKTFKGLPTK